MIRLRLYGRYLRNRMLRRGLSLEFRCGSVSRCRQFRRAGLLKLRQLHADFVCSWTWYHRGQCSSSSGVNLTREFVSPQDGASNVRRWRTSPTDARRMMTTMPSFPSLELGESGNQILQVSRYEIVALLLSSMISDRNLNRRFMMWC